MNVIGQALALNYLTRGLSSGRLSPSLIFAGPDGVGKRSAALELIKGFCCASPAFVDTGDLPRCDQCTSCRRVEEGNHPDVLIMDRSSQAVILGEKPEAQTAVKMEAIRYADKFLRIKPLESKRRCVVIDEAHKMTVDAANALLKILEEPPNNAQFVLLATDERSLPSTVISRCAVVRFRPLSTPDISLWLEREKGLDPVLARGIAERSGGRLGRAVEISEEEESDIMTMSEYKLDEFFEMTARAHWRKEGRRNAEVAVDRMIETARLKMEKGDLSQKNVLETLFEARRRINRFVSPRLVLENLFLKLKDRSL